MGVNDINTNNLPTEGGESNKKNIESTTSSKINQNLQLVSKIYNQLGAEFKNPYMIQTEVKGKNNEYTKISVVNSELNQRAEPEIAITIQPNGNVFFKINPYDHYEEFYFVSKEITPEQLSGEVNRVKDILKTGKVPQDSTLRKIEYPTSDEDLKEWVSAYEDAREAFAQKKNARNNKQK